ASNVARRVPAWHSDARALEMGLYARGTTTSPSVRAKGMVDHVAPAAILLASDDLGAPVAHFYRFSVRPGALQPPRRAQQRDLAVLHDMLRFKLNLPLQGQKLLQCRADRDRALDGLGPRLRNHDRVALVQGHQPLEVSSVERLLEQSVCLDRCSGCHRFLLRAPHGSRVLGPSYLPKRHGRKCVEPVLPWRRSVEE